MNLTKSTSCVVTPSVSTMLSRRCYDTMEMRALVEGYQAFQTNITVQGVDNVPRTLQCGPLAEALRHIENTVSNLLTSAGLSPGDSIDGGFLNDLVLEGNMVHKSLVWRLRVPANEIRVTFIIDLH